MTARTLLRWSAIAVVVLIALVAAAVVVSQTEWAHEQARAMIETRATAALNGELRIGRLDGTFFGGITASDLAVVQNGTPVIAAGSVTARYNAWQVFTTGAIDEIVVRDLRLNVIEEADGWNVLGLGVEREADTQTSGPTIAIDRLEIINGGARIAPREGAVRHVEDLNLVAALDYRNRRLQLDLERAAARDPATGVAIRELSGDVLVAEGDVAFEDLHLATAGSQLDGSVHVRSNGADRIAIDLTAAPLSLAEIAAYVPAARQIGVQPAIELQASGTLAQFAVDLELTSPAGSIVFDGRIGRGDEATTVTGAVRATTVDLARWLQREDLDTIVTADGTVDARIPHHAPEEAVVKFGVRSPELRGAGYRAAAIKAHGQYAGGVLDVQGAATAYGSVIQTDARWDGESLSARGRAANVDVQRLPAALDLPALSTDLTAAYDIAVQGRNFRVDATLAASTVEGATIAADTTVHVERRAGTLSYAVKGAVQGLDLARLRPYVDLPEAREALLDGTVNARIDARGESLDLDSAAADVELHLTDSVVAGARVPQLDVRASLVRRRLDAAITGTVAEVTSAALGLPDDARFRAGGRLDVQVSLPDVRTPGNLALASGRANVLLTDAAFRGLPIESLALDAALAGGVAEIRTFTLRAPDLQASASGTLALAEGADQPSDLTFDVAAADLAALEPLLGQKIAGGATIAGSVTGPAGVLTARGTLDLRQLAVADVNALSVEGKYVVELPAFDVAQATSRFTGTAALVQVGDTNLDRIVADVTYSDGRVELETTIEQQTRTFSLTGSMVPHPDHREIHVTSLGLGAGGAQWQLAPGREAIVQYGPGRLAVKDLTLVSGESRLVVAGALGTTAAGTGPLVVQVEAVRLEDVNQLLLGTHELTGRIDGTARLEGTMESPRVSADLTVADGVIDGVAYERLVATVQYAADRLEIDAALDAGAAGRLTAAGTMPLRFGASAPANAPPFDLRVESDTINLALLEPFTGGHVDELHGTSSIDVRVAGPASAPAITGRVAIVEAGLTLPATGVTYPRLNAVFTLDGTRLLVEQFLITDDDEHTATLSGALNVSIAAAPSDFNLNLLTDDFHLLDNAFGELAVTSDLRVMGDLTQPLVTGTIAVDRARLEVDDLLDQFASGGYEAVADPTVKAPAADVPPGEQPAVMAEREAREATAASNASFSITLDIPDTLVLRGRDLRARGGSFGLGDVNLTIGGALSVSKDPLAPIAMRGALQVVRGSYAFQGRQFQIQRGSELRFSGDAVLNPLIDVTAERQIGGVMVQVHVTGTARAPEIALASDPPLDDGDILSLIAFNQTMNELGTSQRVSLAARAGTLAARALATPLAESVGRALDFDVFEITPVGDAGVTGATVTVGRQLTEDLFVGFRQDFGSDDVSQISFEYRINEFLRLVTTFAQGADRSRTIPRAETAGLDLFWVIRRVP